MGFNFNGLQASVTISGVLPTGPTELSATQTRVTRTFANIYVADTVQTVFTPTAGKTLYVTNVVVTTSVAGTSAWRVGDNIAGASYQANTLLSNCMGGVITAGQSIFINLDVPMIVATALKFIGGGNGIYHVAFTGWEE